MLRAATLRTSIRLFDKPPIFIDPISIGPLPEAPAKAMLESLDAARVPRS
jgi:hypothetical protein